MRCKFCGAEWTLPYKATFEDCPFCLRPLGKTNQNSYASGNPLSDFDIVGTVLRAYKGTNPVVVVPNSITELGSVTPGRGAFYENTVIEKVVLPDTITEIPNGTFIRCTSLREIVLPDTVTEIADEAFKGCTSLREIVFPKYLKLIGGDAFSGCTALTKIVLPDTITEIPNGTFKGCTSLREIVFPKYLKQIGAYAFSGCTALTKIVLPEGVEEIEWCAFEGCTYLEEVVIPKSLKHFECGSSSDFSPFKNCRRIRHIECPGPMLGIFAQSSKYADEVREERERKKQERAAKINAGICPYCGGKIGYFSGMCKSCKRYV